MAGRSPLKPEQQAAFDQLKSKMPVDGTVPGFAVAPAEGQDPDSPWIKNMQRFSKDLAVNAYAYNNYSIRKGRLSKANRKSQRIISPDGFPSWVNISYASPPPFAFYSMNNVREVTHFVFHSFGHMWHATTSAKTKKRVGWMNSERASRGVRRVKFEGKDIYVPTGSDPETMAHFTRFSAGLRACLSSAAKATAHFFIDRAGNLVVVGDCNDVLFTSNGLNKVSLGVEIEEAFYVLKDTRGKNNKALWRPGGNPAGTAGNIEYLTYSPQQMYTLAVLVKKLELAYPALKERNIDFQRKATRPGHPSGYTMHDFIYPGVDKKTGKLKSGHLDVSPHFLDRSLWDAFFVLVDAQEQVTKNNIFMPRTKYLQSGEDLQTKPLSETQLTAMSDRMLQYSQDLGVAQTRVEAIVNDTKVEINTKTATAAAKESKYVAQQVASTMSRTQQTQHPAADYPNYGIPLGSDGQQIGSDDVV